MPSRNFRCRTRCAMAHAACLDVHTHSRSAKALQKQKGLMKIIDPKNLRQATGNDQSHSEYPFQKRLFGDVPIVFLLVGRCRKVTRKTPGRQPGMTRAIPSIHLTRGCSGDVSMIDRNKHKLSRRTNQTTVVHFLPISAIKVSSNFAYMPARQQIQSMLTECRCNAQWPVVMSVRSLCDSLAIHIN